VQDLSHARRQAVHRLEPAESGGEGGGRGRCAQIPAGFEACKPAGSVPLMYYN
jgi:hypothetical protein